MIRIAKVLLVIAQNNYRDEEFEIPKDILSKEHEVDVASISDQEEAISMEGKKVKPTTSLAKALDQIDTYECVVFVGGSGAETLFENEYALQIAVRVFANDKIVAAICIAPMILANAGILTEKKFTSYPNVTDVIKSKGGIPDKKDVVVDENIITANGPAAAKEFGETILKVLKEGPKLQGELE